jgi:uncharacterized phiE125 gp8 family phage protein
VVKGMKLITEPTLSILGATETKNYLRVQHDTDNSLISDLVKVAVSYVEKETYLDIVPRQWQQNAEGGADKIELFKAPIISVDEVKKYTNFDSSGELMTESTDFRVVDNYLIHKSGYWSEAREIDGYVIKYTTGLFTGSNYTSSQDPRLADFKLAALKFCAWLYENREEYVVQVAENYSVSYDYNNIPQSITKILRPYTRGVFL